MTGRIRILWVAATPLELACAPTRPTWSALATGCGPAAAGAGLALHLGREQSLPDLVVGVGIAGAFPGSGVEVGETRLVVADNFCDLGCEDGEAFLDLVDLRIPDAGVDASYPCVVPDFLSHLPKSVATTCSVCTGSGKTAEFRRLRTGAALESMEGAAWALACKRSGVPFAQVRSVSNMAGPRDRGAWKIPEALKGLRQELEEACAKI